MFYRAEGEPEGGDPEKKERPEAIGAAGVFVVRRTDQSVEFLLAPRLGELEHGRLSPPGGKMEREEGPHGCAIRELREEAGLKVEADDLVFIYRGTQIFKKGTFRFRGYLVIWRPEMGEPQHKEPKEHGEWEWVNEREMDDLAAEKQLSAAAELMLKAYRRYLERLRREAVGPSFMGDFKPLEEDAYVDRLLGDEREFELLGEQELLSRARKMYIDDL